MKLDIARFVKDQAERTTLRVEETGEIELSSTDLETVCGGRGCEGNDFPYGDGCNSGFPYGYGDGGNGGFPYGYGDGGNGGFLYGNSCNSSFLYRYGDGCNQ